MRNESLSAANRRVDGKMLRKLKGVQHTLAERFPPRAYRVRTKNGTSVLCDEHLEALRKRMTVTLTGESFDKDLCDECNPKTT